MAFRIPQWASRSSCDALQPVAILFPHPFRSLTSRPAPGSATETWRRARVRPLLESQTMVTTSRGFQTGYKFSVESRGTNTSKIDKFGVPTDLPGGMKRKNQSAMYYTVSLIIGTIALAYGSVPLYKMICQQTGWGGQPVSTHQTQGDPASRLHPVTDSRRLRITFNGSVSDVLPWKFVPQQREVRVLPGESALAFYTATNRSDADIVGIATYSVTPAQVSPYFSKIQCFCFEEQRLNSGESVDMPVFFFIDPDFVNDPNMRGIDTITLSYTFFKAKYDNNGSLRPVPKA